MSGEKKSRCNFHVHYGLGNRVTIRTREDTILVHDPFVD
jgi:hypothetical protein